MDDLSLINAPTIFGERYILSYNIMFYLRRENIQI